MSYQHTTLAQGRWHQLTFFQQMANIGTEVGRAIIWRSKDAMTSEMAAVRGLELIDLTIDDVKNRTGARPKELWRLREVFADYFFADNEYGSTDQSWQNYFDGFAYGAQVNKL